MKRKRTFWATNFIGLILWSSLLCGFTNRTESSDSNFGCGQFFLWVALITGGNLGGSDPTREEPEQDR